jgi:hypothetical protein
MVFPVKRYFPLIHIEKMVRMVGQGFGTEVGQPAISGLGYSNRSCSVLQSGSSPSFHDPQCTMG